MTPEQHRYIRRLAKKYRIFFKGPISPEEWPPLHKDTFSNIRKIGEQRYETFCASIDIQSTEKPWREKTRHRADWLARRAALLRRERRNEAGWRFGLENDVFGRFTIEVACYEVGTNPPFSDRAQELIIHEPILKSELPKQEQPDRVYGLQQTKNFEKLLSEPVVPSIDSNVVRKPVGETIKSSPFPEDGEPQLFPFLIVEAKSEKGHDGFDAIEMQTAFPIRTLLKLQQDLLNTVAEHESKDSPLVWFFANRGDDWRVYCGYTAKKDGVVTYEVLDLWNGRILSKDGALQLLLIVDYIFDWARDIDRPSILRQLKILSTVDASDAISLSNDSDIFSMRGYVSNWIPPPPSAQEVPDVDILDTGEDQDEDSLLAIPVPNTKLGVVRSASIIESQNALFDLVVTSTFFTFFSDFCVFTMALVCLEQLDIDVIKDEEEKEEEEAEEEEEEEDEEEEKEKLSVVNICEEEEE
ncbi:MAG: hypothetical protein M1830_008245 [Pleopsidium flavum]|nr:MAG: hypothetical protein M1830_008245 [Pleopsidium flavum]